MTNESSLKPTFFWLFLSLGLLFFFGGTLLSENICREYVINPAICDSMNIFNDTLPYLMIITFLLSFIVFLLFAIHELGNAFNPKAKRLRAKERRIGKRG